MPAPELSPLIFVQPTNDSYPALEGVFDPLELAASAIAKLREHGLATYIAPSHLLRDNRVTPATDEAVIEDPIKVNIGPTISAPPAPDRLPTPQVANLDEYRARRRKQLDAAAQIRLVAKAQQGDPKALEDIWVDAQTLAAKVASHKNSKISHEDKIQIGLEVVPAAVRRYDPDNAKGGKL